MKKISLIIAAILLLTSPCFAVTHYVSPSGSATWANSTTMATPCSLSTANANAKAGDIVYLKAGTYQTGGGSVGIGIIEPNNSGSSVSSRITYSKTAGEAKPVIEVTTAGHSGAYLNNRSYIKLDGIIFIHTYASSGIRYNIEMTSNSNYIEITNCEFYGNALYGIQIGEPGVSSHNWIHNNILTGRAGSGCSEGTDAIKIGDAWQSYYQLNNTVENNLFYNSGHAHLDSYNIRYTVIRNNIFHNEPWWPATKEPCGYSQGAPPNSWYASYTDSAFDHKWGHRNFQVGFNQDNSKTYTLVEGNRAGWESTNPGNSGTSNFEIAGQGIVIRYNDFYAAWTNGVGFKYVNAPTHGGGGTNCRFFNNTLYNNGGRLKDSACGSGNTPCLWNYGIMAYATAPTGNVIKNNIVYISHDGDGISDGMSYFTVSNNWYTSTGDPKFTNPALTDPTSQNLFSDKAGYLATPIPDLTLQAASGAINAGTHLTTAVGAGTNSTTLVVTDALYFQDGTWGSALARAGTGLGGTFDADWIAIGTVNNVVQIRSVNYTTNTITLSSSMTWNNNTPVWLYKKSDGTIVLYGSAPDMGAHEYKPLVTSSLYTKTAEGLYQWNGSAWSQISTMVPTGMVVGF